MPTVSADELRTLTRDVFASAGARTEDAAVVADSLVGANLAGHDSHGVLRIPEYVRWMEQKLVNLDAELQVVLENDGFVLVDGQWGFGQVMGRRTAEIAIRKAAQSGAVTVSGRNFCHLGRVGEYPEIIAGRGMASVMFVNTHGGGKLVAPYGGIERRLSANPISVGIPVRSGAPIVVDISTCAIAEGKVRTMLNGGRSVPPGSVIDANGNASTDPAALYGPPQGALLPFGGHKGFALGLVADILAGAISGAGCSRPDANRIGNSFLITVIDIDHVRGRAEFDEDVRQLVQYVKSSKTAPGVSEILVPGEPEARERERREKEGIRIDEETWRQIAETAAKYGVETAAISPP